MNKRALFRVFLLLLLVLFLSLFRTGPSARAEDVISGQERTLSDQAVFTGKADAGTTLTCTVYTYRGNDRILLYQTRTTIGQSGLYSLTVPLPLIGSQFVMLDLEEERLIYEYTRYPRSLGTEITGLDLNIYEYLLQKGEIRPGGRP